MRVVGAALGVVVVRDDHTRALEAGRLHEIETVEPVHGLADLVDLVHRHAEASERQGRSAREHDGASLGELRGQGLRHRRSLPHRQRVRWAPRPGEDEAGRAKPRERGGLGDRRALRLIGGERAQKAGRLDRELDAMTEVLDGSLGDLRRVLLESVGGVEQDRAGRRVAQSRDDLAMGRDHGGRGLARSHDRQDARQAGAHAKNPSRTAPARRSPTRDGNSRCRSW